MAYSFFLWFYILSNTLSRHCLCSIFSQKDGGVINAQCCRPRFCIREKEQRWPGGEGMGYSCWKFKPFEGMCRGHPCERVPAVAPLPGWREGSLLFLWGNLVHSQCGYFNGKPIPVHSLCYTFYAKCHFHRLWERWVWCVGVKERVPPRLRSPVHCGWHIR